MTMAQTPSRLRLRRAKREDAARLAELATQLGYPSTARQVRARLNKMLRARGNEVFVAEGRHGDVIGWVHVSASHLVESDPQAEIGGLIVDSSARGQGAGRLLMEWAERWARRSGLRSVYLRSNVIRKDAHAFYRNLGYEIIKTQHAFRKKLSR